jgi:hypothetical protein
MPASAPGDAGVRGPDQLVPLRGEDVPLGERQHDRGDLPGRPSKQQGPQDLVLAAAVLVQHQPPVRRTNIS